MMFYGISTNVARGSSASSHHLFKSGRALVRDFTDLKNTQPLHTKDADKKENLRKNTSGNVQCD